MNNEKNDALVHQLYAVLATLKDEDEVRAFFSDLCTVQEIDYMAQRVEAARLLMSGKTYQEVTDSISISSATLTRVSKCVKADRGYRRLLGRYLEGKTED